MWASRPKLVGSKRQKAAPKRYQTRPNSVPLGRRHVIELAQLAFEPVEVLAVEPV